MAKINGRWCCECDFCADSPCSADEYVSVISIFFKGGPFNYVGCCQDHTQDCRRYILNWITRYAHVRVENSDGEQLNHNALNALLAEHAMFRPTEEIVQARRTEYEKAVRQGWTLKRGEGWSWKQLEVH